MKNVGDIVHIKNNLESGEDYGTDTFVSEMAQYCGATATIVKLYNNEYILDVDDGDWCWTDEMFED